jgi:hypothetical protein
MFEARGAASNTRSNAFMYEYNEEFSRYWIFTYETNSLTLWS